jgi:hypothetical protein
LTGFAALLIPKIVLVLVQRWPALAMVPHPRRGLFPRFFSQLFVDPSIFSFCDPLCFVSPTFALISIAPVALRVCAGAEA